MSLVIPAVVDVTPRKEWHMSVLFNELMGAAQNVSLDDAEAWYMGVCECIDATLHQLALLFSDAPYERPFNGTTYIGQLLAIKLNCIEFRSLIYMLAAVHGDEEKKRTLVTSYFATGHPPRASFDASVLLSDD